MGDAMKRRAIVLLFIFSLLVGLVQSDRVVQASAIASAHVSDVWRSGIQVNGSSAPYAAISGRARSAAAVFSSAAGDSYYMVAAPAVATVICMAQVYLLDRSGSYTGSAGLTLEALDLDGSLRTVLSSAALDLQSASPQAWLSLGLVHDPALPILQPGQFLAYHFHLDGAASGNLNMALIFEAAASDHPYAYALPAVIR
jgi:hypothetical protein